MKLARAAHRFQPNLAGRLTIWITVVALAVVAVRCFAMLALGVAAADTLDFSHAVLLVLGVFAARMAWLLYGSFLRPPRVVAGRE